MKIGFASIYSARPQPQFAVYLASLFRNDGHEVSFLTCDSSFPCCLNHVVRELPRTVECGICILGGIRSFPVKNIWRVRRSLNGGLDQQTARKLAFSSAVNVSRAESEAQFRGQVVEDLQAQFAPSVDIAYTNARQWITKEKLEGVILFNGRMEVTRGILQACRDAGISFLTYERTLVGHGLWMVPNEDCMFLARYNEVLAAYRDVPLNGLQACRSASFLAQRLLRRTKLEWRIYNQSAKEIAWPVAGAKRKILVLPGSRSEREGNPAWKSAYDDLPAALSELCPRIDARPHEVVVRAHPLWTQAIGKWQGCEANNVWRYAATQAGYHFIESDSNVDTLGLIRQADLIVSNGSSALLEAGAMGKRCICIGHSHYETAGFARHILEPSDWESLARDREVDSLQIIRRTLRCIYTQGWRYPQYVDFVRGITPTEYQFLEGGSSLPLLEMLRTGIVQVNDTLCGTDDGFEYNVARRFEVGDIEDLSRFEEENHKRTIPIKRRMLLRWVDVVRKMGKKGDL